MRGRRPAPTTTNPGITMFGAPLPRLLDSLERMQKDGGIKYLGTGALSVLGWALAARRMVGRKGAILDIISAI